MSEIKGQLLGIVLVLMIFGAISAAMVAIFNTLTTSIQNDVNEIANSSGHKAFSEYHFDVSYHY